MDHMAMQSKWNRVFIIGLDGATWSVLDPMIERGVMPNLARLKARAAHGDMLSCVPPVTSAAWTTMVTGNGPQRHGVYDHRRYDAESRRIVQHFNRVFVPRGIHRLVEVAREVRAFGCPASDPHQHPRYLGVSVVNHNVA